MSLYPPGFTRTHHHVPYTKLFRSDADLPRCSDDEVGVGELGRVQVTPDVLLRDLPWGELALGDEKSEFADSVDDLCPAPVVQGDRQGDRKSTRLNSSH